MKSLLLSCALAVCCLVAVPAVASAGHFYRPYRSYVRVSRPAYYVAPVTYHAPVRYHHAPVYHYNYRPRYYSVPRYYYGGPRYYGGYPYYGGYRGGVSVNIGW